MASLALTEAPGGEVRGTTARARRRRAGVGAGGERSGQERNSSTGVPGNAGASMRWCEMRAIGRSFDAMCQIGAESTVSGVTRSSQVNQNMRTLFPSPHAFAVVRIRLCMRFSLVVTVSTRSESPLCAWVS